MVSREFFRECVSVLEENGIDSAYFDTKCIFEDFPDKSRDEILSLVKRRSEGYPLQYLLGQWEFYGYTFKVNENVLIPRADTELIIENVLDICRKNNLQSPKIADLCSGSGCIGITLKKQIPSADVYSVEISEKAVEVIHENSVLNNVEINIINADVLDTETAVGLPEFDIIVCNPPYLTQKEMDELQKEVTFEPSLALFGGADGLDFYRAVTEIWKNSLCNDGWIIYESGDGQHEDIKNILGKNNFYNITFSRDLNHIIRNVSAQNRRICNG
ncbi:MAG: peptide chain release factor N(5)-glutamine methyltransferase [Ruminococcus flavefaciens]|nr:peptide chain release factor N(5)-glutamine methyltransferase [Ruminococcus flavefaciens]